MQHPYAVPDRLSPHLERVMAYWKGLLRGGADMPFWDDAKLSDLPDLKPGLVLIDVFARPERFRMASVGDALTGACSAGSFIDETDLKPPLDFLRSQASATVECAQPTFFARAPGAGAPAYARLLLPMWGDGRIGMLLGAVDLS
jgi:hypothetical protein